MLDRDARTFGKLDVMAALSLSSWSCSLVQDALYVTLEQIVLVLEKLCPPPSPRS